MLIKKYNILKNINVRFVSAKEHTPELHQVIGNTVGDMDITRTIVLSGSTTTIFAAGVAYNVIIDKTM